LRARMGMRQPVMAGLVATACVCAPGPSSADAEWVIGGYLGAAHTTSAPLSLVQPAAGTDVTFASIDYAGRSFSPPVYYGYRLTYFLPRAPWIGLEGEFIHLKTYARTGNSTRASGRLQGEPYDRTGPVREILESFSMSHGLNFVLANVVFRRTMREPAGAAGHLAVAGRVGMGPTVPHPESRIGGVSHEGYELGARGLHASVGFGVRMWRGLSATAEYKRTHTHQRVTVADGEAGGRFTSHHGVVGLGWHF
jgi:hypothetical protein